MTNVNKIYYKSDEKIIPALPLSGVSNGIYVGVYKKSCIFYKFFILYAPLLT